MIVTLNINSINEKISKALAYSEKTLSATEKLARAKVQTEKKELIRQFEDHPASVDIKAGPDRRSTIIPNGSLFGFLGFRSNREPISEMKSFLRNFIQLKRRKPIIKVGRLYANHQYQVEIPSNSDINQAKEAQVDWDGPVINWVEKLKTGFSNFEYYLAVLRGRSTGGVQSKHKVREGGFTPVERYLIDMLEDMRKRIEK